ncbi:hypothetical protein B0919_07980 [Hymenobacter sp. CRA2]|nr:hypothetical protein B0919_07980 [Hymenobacter sp. CRA2]
MYWLASAALAVVVVLNLINGNSTWPRLLSLVALLGAFSLLGLYPPLTERPTWASWLISLLLLLAFGLLVLRLTGRLV